MTLNRLGKENGFFCGSCSKKIIDFRGKASDDITKTIEKSTEKVCGIYHSKQLTVSKFSWRNALLYKLLTIAAFMGFNVKPLKAQVERIETIPPTTIKIEFKKKEKAPYHLQTARTAVSIVAVEAPKKKLFKKRKKKERDKTLIGYL